MLMSCERCKQVRRAIISPPPPRRCPPRVAARVWCADHRDRHTHGAPAAGVRAQGRLCAVLAVWRRGRRACAHQPPSQLRLPAGTRWGGRAALPVVRRRCDSGGGRQGRLGYPPAGCGMPSQPAHQRHRCAGAGQGVNAVGAGGRRGGRGGGGGWHCATDRQAPSPPPLPPRTRPSIARPWRRRTPRCPQRCWSPRAPCPTPHPQAVRCRRRRPRCRRPSHCHHRPAWRRGPAPGPPHSRRPRTGMQTACWRGAAAWPEVMTALAPRREPSPCWRGGATRVPCLVAIPSARRRCRHSRRPEAVPTTAAVAWTAGRRLRCRHRTSALQCHHRRLHGAPRPPARPEWWAWACCLGRTRFRAPPPLPR
jgi:hypothetical protein